MTVYFPNGGIRQIFDIPVEMLLVGSAVDLANLPGVSAPVAAPAAYYPPPVYAAPSTDPVLAALPGIVTGIGLGMAIGGMHGYHGGFER